MEDVAQLIALAVLAIVAVVAATLAWRTARWTVRTRRYLAFRAVIGDVAGRAEGILAQITERVDVVRRGTMAGREILDDIATARGRAAALAGEARALRGPAGSEGILAGIVDELDRAGRALEMIEHGCSIADEGRGREHDPEAQTAIKRGYLNLIHARENIAGHDAAAAALLANQPRMFGRRISS